ncbi:tRNA (adenosine(37)-N6)-threonylcarbamoyltransferase complex dimerization subunit type 1 TsaB [Flaviaesturariibacter aridisoli]|uniref:tRNA (adenosine(37)-N6)-threonylcarbamoyltransferase complex dimerization subunit type 1 TsaB n=1 Tax=Flaviaesturariibacter aridisoli TaxID=2545761 RepID=UPI0014052557|nr:tRNA (adenosine(37)-N6)-threonylcarbamoyltransferase complex dimerization subunit type 1 TsaB [Flaviaesturariibacter aridisoli]
MALLLHIETAVAGASIAFSENERILVFKNTDEPRDAAAWLQVAIRDAAAEAGITLSALDAVCVSNGPGSYTGLRVGLASAKGLSYALQKPLITLPTLQVMSAAALEGLRSGAAVQLNEVQALCPMIDARRQEVFTALYDQALQELAPAHSLVLDENSFARELEAGPVLFFGNGSAKWRALTQHPHALFTEGHPSARHMAGLGVAAFRAGQFADLAYCEPLYAKEFYTTMRPK